MRICERLTVSDNNAEFQIRLDTCALLHGLVTQYWKHDSRVTLLLVKIRYKSAVYLEFQDSGVLKNDKEIEKDQAGKPSSIP